MSNQNYQYTGQTRVATLNKKAKSASDASSNVLQVTLDNFGMEILDRCERRIEALGERV